MENLTTDAISTAQQPPASLKQLCTARHLAVISRKIADWRAVSPFLGLTEADECAILESNPHSEARRIAMLRKWKQKEGAKATYKRLCRAFRECERADLTDLVEQLVTENSGSSDEEGKSCLVYACPSFHVVPQHER